MVVPLPAARAFPAGWPGCLGSHDQRRPKTWSATLARRRRATGGDGPDTDVPGSRNGGPWAAGPAWAGRGPSQRGFWARAPGGLARLETPARGPGRGPGPPRDGVVGGCSPAPGGPGRRPALRPPSPSRRRPPCRPRGAWPPTRCLGPLERVNTAGGLRSGWAGRGTAHRPCRSGPLGGRVVTAVTQGRGEIRGLRVSE